MTANHDPGFDRRDERTIGNLEERGTDETRMRNQSELWTSRGNSWLVVGAAFGVIAGVLLFGLADLQFGVALATLAILVVLFVVMAVIRFTVHPVHRRLLMLAVTFAAMAIIGVVGVLWIGFVEYQ